MNRWFGRIALFGGMLSALMFVPIGMMMTVFGFGQVVINWFEIAIAAVSAKKIVRHCYCKGCAIP